MSQNIDFETMSSAVMTFICSDLHVWNLKAYNLYENKIAIVKKTQLFLQQFYIFCMNIFIYFKFCTTLFHQWFQRNYSLKWIEIEPSLSPHQFIWALKKKEIEIRGLGKKREHIESKNIPRAMSIAIFCIVLYCLPFPRSCQKICQWHFLLYSSVY